MEKSDLRDIRTAVNEVVLIWKGDREKKLKELEEQRKKEEVNKVAIEYDRLGPYTILTLSTTKLAEVRNQRIANKTQVTLVANPGSSTTVEVRIGGTPTNIREAVRLIEAVPEQTVGNPAMAGGSSQQGYQPAPRTSSAPSGPPVQQLAYGYAPQYNASQPYYPGYPYQGAAVAPTQQTSQAGGYYQAPPSTAPYYNASPPSYHTSGQGHGYPQYGYNQQGHGNLQYGYNQQSYPQDGYGIYQPPGYDQHGYHGLSPTSQTGYWTQQPAQCGYGYGDAQSSYGSTEVQPGYGTPSYDAPPSGQPGYGAPPSGQPGYGTPSYRAPPFGQPGYGTPSYVAPPSGQPGYGAPPSGQPGYGAAGYTQPSTYSPDGGNGNTHGA